VHCVYTVYITNITVYTINIRRFLVKIIISNTSGIPIYEQIKDQIKSAILSGEVEENELLPSLRQLAKDLKISVLTTTRAYTELEQEGYVTNVQGKGCYVMGRGSELIREQLLRDIEDNLAAAIKSARRAEVSSDELVKMLRILMEDDYNE
jgi:GntR family transcriptional regulator